MTAEATEIWFGILALIVVEVGLITPPVGMNLFIINSMAKDILYKIPIMECCRFCHGYARALISFPAISLWLVTAMFN